MRIHHLTLFAIFLFACTTLRAQQVVVSGRVIDSVGNPVAKASITYRESKSPAILGYAISKPDGSYQLVIMTVGDSIELTISHLSYKKVQRLLPNRTAEYNIELEAGNTELDEVILSPLPIRKRGDTISYAVNAFAAKGDLVIGEIIRKLPGIEMVDGRIFYQGKPIQKYMVNNLDLMEGRYGMINENLRADAVIDVQVVENDQPIKVLDSLVISDRASLNLKLKKAVTITATGRAGVGGNPVIWTANFTPMVFGKTFQSLISLQTNNSGEDASRNLQPFYTGGHLFRPSGENTNGPSFLSVRNVASPGFEESKWLDNRLFLVTANALQKLSGGLEVKGNVSYYNDLRHRRGFTATDMFLPGGQILLTERVDNRYGIDDLTGGILVEKNEEQVYLRNKLNYHKRWNRDIGTLLLNRAEDVRQERRHDDYSLLNSFSMARFIGNQLVTIQSVIEYGETPQYLSVEPGQLIAALNAGVPYQRMRQRIDYRQLRTENELSFVRRIGWWSITPSILANYQWNRLASGITLTDNAEDIHLGMGYINDMVTWRSEMGAGIRFNYKRGDWTMYGSLPLSLHVFNVRQQGLRPLHNAARGTLNPTTSVHYRLDVRQELSAGMAYTQEFEEMDNLYNAYIIGSYRSIQRYSARLLGSRGIRSGLSYRYGNTRKGVFADASYSYSNRLQDYLFEASVDSLGQSEVRIADRNGRNIIHGLSANYGVFFPSIKTVAKLRTDARMGQIDYQLNGVMAARRHQSWQGTLELTNSMWDYLGLSYRWTQGGSITHLAGGMSNIVKYQHHFLQIDSHIGDRHSFSAENAYYRNNIEGVSAQYFLDCSYSYHVVKWNTDVVLEARNVLGNDRYTQQVSSDYQLVETYFEMRPRQFLISTRFRF